MLSQLIMEANEAAVERRRPPRFLLAAPALANPDGIVVDARASSFQALTAIQGPLGR